MILNNANTFINNSIAGTRPCNGMYLLYTRHTDTTLPTITTSDTLNTIKDKVRVLPEVGLARIHKITPALTTGENHIYATTDTAEYVFGLAFAAGVYARATMLANLQPHAADDTALNYNTTAATVIPANGSVTFIDNITISNTTT